MSERLQVLLDEAELRAIRRAARRQRLSVSEWVRRALRAARDREAGADATSKLEAVRVASAQSFPTADVEQMLEEIERGYAPQP